MVFPGEMRNRAPNYTDVLHQVGDEVWTTYVGANYMAENAAYKAEVIEVVTNQSTRGLGTHYVLYVKTNEANYVCLTNYRLVWETKEAFEESRKYAEQEAIEFRARMKRYTSHDK